jgi:hypothetical protein
LESSSFGAFKVTDSNGNEILCETKLSVVEENEASKYIQIQESISRILVSGIDATKVKPGTYPQTINVSLKNYPTVSAIQASFNIKIIACEHE